MAYKMLLKSVSGNLEHRKVGLGFLAGFLLSLMYLWPSIYFAFPFSTVDIVMPVSKFIQKEEGRQNVITHESKGNNTEINGENTISDEHKSDTIQITDGQTMSMTNGSTLEEVVINSDRLEYEKSEKDVPQREPRCDLSDPRYDLCEVDGDIRIQGNSTSIQFLTSSSKNNESWRIQPYPRKQDKLSMAKVTEVVLKPVKRYEDLPLCNFNHSVPAIIFSTAGYTGNFYHDFADIIIPLIITSYQFSAEVQFLVTGLHSWWIQKYLPIFSNLSRYEIINFDEDSRVHCFPHVIVGLVSHKELSIDPSRSPNGYSMVEFAKFLKNTYSLPRVYVTRLTTKPRVVIIARRSTRKFANLGEIVRMVEESGCEVKVMEAESGSDLGRISELVNSCDVMIGVHGAGLTNMVFLPEKAVVVQIVPWGRLESIAQTCFKVPAIDMKLNYLEYGISEEESTLVDLYPRNHTVFKDPMSLHKKGWIVMGKVYLSEQNVKLDVRRFKPVLLQALKLVHNNK